MTASTAMLSLEQTPPMAVPFRFFLTAPLFGLAACLLAAFNGPAILLSRWQPELLAVTHLFTLGYLAMVMCGAMFQLLPVLAGVQIARTTKSSAVVHLLLTAGTVSLAIAFIVAQPLWFGMAIALLAAAVVLFIAVIGRALLRAKSLHDTVWAMRLALFAFAVTLLFGVWLAAGHAGWGALVRHFTDLHLAWGLLGWGGVLLAGVAYQVVPMFQVTKEYPRPLRRVWGWSVIGLLLLASALLMGGLPSRVAGYGLAMAFVALAVVTLRLQQRRLRRLPDVTVDFWRLGLAAMILAALLWLLQSLLPPAWAARAELGWGVLAIVGAAVSLISGMLYKIVPFLVWLHLNNRLQAAGAWQGRIPHMKQVIAERWTRRHLHLHLAGTVLLLGATLSPRWLLYPALLLLLAAFAVQLRNLSAAVLLYRRVAAQQ